MTLVAAAVESRFPEQREPFGRAARLRGKRVLIGSHRAYLAREASLACSLKVCVCVIDALSLPPKGMGHLSGCPIFYRLTPCDFD